MKLYFKLNELITTLINKYELNKTIGILSILMVLMSCTSNTIMKKPDDLIPKKEMINLMTDIYIANAAFNIYNKYGERQRNYLSLVYEKYGVDSAIYNRSNLYYMSRIDEYEKMHKKVSEKIKDMKMEKEAEYRVFDSIKRSQKK